MAFLVLLAVETCQFSGVPSSHFGTFDFLELENAVYEVEISSAPVSELQLHQNAQKEEVCTNFTTYPPPSKARSVLAVMT